MDKQEILSAVAEESIDLSTLPTATTLAEVTSLPGVSADGSLKSAPLSLIGAQVTNEVNAKTAAIQQTANAAVTAANTANTAANNAQAIAEAAKVYLFREQWKVCGGVYNETTGFYEMNGLTDITYEQAKEIMYAPSSAPGFVGYVPKARTNVMPARGIYGGGMYGALADLSAVCYNNTKIEVLALAPVNTRVQTNNIKCMCIWCGKLKKIIGIISCVNIDNGSGYSSTFQSCAALEEVWLQWWNMDVDLHWSPNLKMECVEYFVENRSGSNAIAMKLHPDAFARLTDELIATAATKNITFIETA